MSVPSALDCQAVRKSFKKQDNARQNFGIKRKELGIRNWELGIRNYELGIRNFKRRHGLGKQEVGISTSLDYHDFARLPRLRSTSTTTLNDLMDTELRSAKLSRRSKCRFRSRTNWTLSFVRQGSRGGRSVDFARWPLTHTHGLGNIPSVVISCKQLRIRNYELGIIKRVWF